MNGSDPVPAVLRVVIDELLADPRAAELMELARNANELVSAFRQQHERANPGPSHGDREPPREPAMSPRKRLLFGEREPLSPPLIRKRRAALAALCHPDAGGDAHVMAELNATADALLAQCARKDS